MVCKILRWTLALVLVASVASASEATPSAGYLITKSSAGPVKLGMTIAEARKVLPGRKLARTMDGDGVALVEVRNGQTVEMHLYAGEADPEKPIDEKGRVEVVRILGEKYRTAEGVHPGMPVREIEKRYGKLSKVTMSEIESREYAEFPKAPQGLVFQVGAPEVGMVGKYAEGKRESKTYAPSAVVVNIEISGGPFNP